MNTYEELFSELETIAEGFFQNVVQEDRKYKGNVQKYGEQNQRLTNLLMHVPEGSKKMEMKGRKNLNIIKEKFLELKKDTGFQVGN